MRILHTADWHLGKEWQGVDRVSDLVDHVIPEIVDIALHERVELVIVAGDILDGFGRQSMSLCSMLLRRPIKQLLEAGVHVVMIPGNHDNRPMFRLLDAALNINPLSETARLIIFTEPNVQLLDGVQIIGMPYLTPRHLGQLLSRQGIMVPVEADLQNQTLSRQYEGVLHAVKANVDGRKPAVLIGHFSVSGTRFRPEEDRTSYAGYETSYARDLVISRDALLSSDQIPQYNALGHLHRGQCVSEAVAVTYYAGAPERFERGEANYQPQVLLVELPNAGEVQVKPVSLTRTTPFINEVISDEMGLRSLVDRTGQEASQRLLGDLIIKVDDIADYPPLRDQAYDLFPRLKVANTVRPETPGLETPVKFEATTDYTRIVDPRAVFDEYFSKSFSEEQVTDLQKALDAILGELENEN